MKNCPYCGKEIQEDAKKCKYCWKSVYNEESTIDDGTNDVVLDELNKDQFISSVELLSYVCTIDGEATPEEINLVQNFGLWNDRFSLNIENILNDFIDKIQDKNTSDILDELEKNLDSLSKENKRKLLERIAFIIKADGVKSSEELAIFNYFRVVWKINYIIS